MLSGSKELKILIERPWTRIKTIKSSSAVLLDLVIETDVRALIIHGEDHLVDIRTDDFSLSIKQHEEKTWWPSTVTTPGFTTEVWDLTTEWSGRPVSRLFLPPRAVRFFTSAYFDRVISTRKAVLMRCVAMQFYSLDDPRARLLITAEQMNVSVFVDDECEEQNRDYFIDYTDEVLKLLEI